MRNHNEKREEGAAVTEASSVMMVKGWWSLLGQVPNPIARYR